MKSSRTGGSLSADGCATRLFLSQQDSGSMTPQTFIDIILAGIGACIVFDLWQRGLQRLTGIPPSNWAMVGRWLIGLVTGHGMIQAGLAPRPAYPRELPAGWALHYAVAIGYAAVYAAMMQAGWITAGALDGLLFGVVSVVVPWFFFMPATGTGLMARLSPNPRLACGLALKMHAIFGVALGTGFAMLAA